MEKFSHRLSTEFTLNAFFPVVGLIMLADNESSGTLLSERLSTEFKLNALFPIAGLMVLEANESSETFQRGYSVNSCCPL